MSGPDIINGLFEASGGIVNFFNVLALRRDKRVQGVRIFPTILFTVWGIWNFYYYPHLGQWVSFFGGLSIVFGNAYWVALAVWYSRREQWLSTTQKKMAATEL